MANYKHKPHLKSCGLCKPWKRQGNSKGAIKPKYRKTLDRELL